MSTAAVKALITLVLMPRGQQFLGARASRAPTPQIHVTYVLSCRFGGRDARAPGPLPLSAINRWTPPETRTQVVGIAIASDEALIYNRGRASMARC